jgi:hypothetical protein
MKLLAIKSGVVLAIIGVIIFGNLEVGAADWTYYADTGTKGDVYYYDKESITFLPEGVVRVRERVIKDEDLRKAFEEKKEAVEKFIERRVSGKKAISKEESDKIYEEWQKEFLRDLVIAEKRVQIESKCGDKKFRLISGVEYDGKGNAIRGLSGSPSDWLQIIPETPIERLYKILCPDKAN